MPPPLAPADTTWATRIARQRNFHLTTLTFQRLHAACITRCTCPGCTGGTHCGIAKRCQGPLGRQREQRYREKWGWLEQWGVGKGMVIERCRGPGSGSGGVEEGMVVVVEEEVTGATKVEWGEEMIQGEMEEEEREAKKRKRVDGDDGDDGKSSKSTISKSKPKSKPKPQPAPSMAPTPTNQPPQSPPKRTLRTRTRTTTTKSTAKPTTKPTTKPTKPKNTSPTTIPMPTGRRGRTTSFPTDWVFYRPPPLTKRPSKQKHPAFLIKKPYNKRKSLMTPTGELNLDKLIWLCNRAAAASASKGSSNSIVELSERKRWLGRNLRVGMGAGGSKRG